MKQQGNQWASRRGTSGQAAGGTSGQVARSNGACRAIQGRVAAHHAATLSLVALRGLSTLVIKARVAAHQQAAQHHRRQELARQPARPVPAPPAPAPQPLVCLPPHSGSAPSRPVCHPSQRHLGPIKSGGIRVTASHLSAHPRASAPPSILLSLLLCLAILDVRVVRVGRHERAPEEGLVCRPRRRPSTQAACALGGVHGRVSRARQ
jgi:hypothetical protein